MRQAREAAGPQKIVGVTAFPLAKEGEVEVETPRPRAVEAPSPRVPGPDGHCPALKPVRLSQAHEAA